MHSGKRRIRNAIQLSKRQFTDSFLSLLRLLEYFTKCQVYINLINVQRKMENPSVALDMLENSALVKKKYLRKATSRNSQGSVNFLQFYKKSMCIATQQEPDFYLFLRLIEKELQVMKKGYNAFFFFLRSLLFVLQDSIPSVTGFKFCAKGKFGKSMRKKVKAFTVGNIQIGTKRKKIEYYQRNF